MFKDPILSEVRITGPDYIEDAELVSWFRSRGTQGLLSHEKILIYHQLYRAVLNFFRLRNLSVQLEPLDVCKELALVVYGVDYVVASRALLPSMAHQSNLKYSSQNRNEDSSQKIAVLCLKFAQSGQFSGKEPLHNYVSAY